MFWSLAALASGLTVAMRVPMLTTPLTVDEGGYGYVVRMWTRGAPLYDTVWVDRPQGLLLVYRAAFAVFGDSALTIRGLAALFAALTVLVLAEIGRRVTGSNVAGVTVGLLFALLSAAPQMEGHTANGELLSALPGSVAVLCVVASVDARNVFRRRWWLWGAGLFAGGALLVKQSAYDAVIVVGIVAAVAGYRARKRFNVSMLADIAVLGFGGALIIGAAALHGMTLGWARWWFAVAGYRLSVENLSSGTLFDRTARLLRSFFIVRIHIVPILGFILLRITTIRRGSLRQWLPLLWLSASLSAFALGGLFHAHYYVGLIAAVSLCGGQGLHALAKRRATGLHWAVALAVVLLAPSLVYSQHALGASASSARSLRSSFDARLPKNEAVASWLDTRTAPNEPVYALYADAALYYVADRPSPYRYLWERGVERIPGAIGELAGLLEGPDAPRYVIQYSLPERISGGGIIERVLGRNYHRVAKVEGVVILQRNDADRLWVKPSVSP